MKVLLIAPVEPPQGGMAIQAQQLLRLLRQEGLEASLFASNFALPAAMRFLERVPVVRTFARAILIWFLIAPAVRRSDVVHILAASWLYFFVVVYPAVAMGRLYRKRVVVNYRGGAAETFFRRCGWLVAPVFRTCNSVTTPSNFLSMVIRRHFAVPVTIVPNVLDHSAFQFRHRTAFGPRLLVTRQLERIYDIPSVLKAFRAVQDRHPEASLWIAGTGSEEADLRRLTATLHLENVRFLGQLAHRELPQVYAECDIYVNASRVDNFPGSLLEASAAGLVIVTTGPGGIPFLYENGRTAFIVEPGDWQGLAQAIETVLAVPSRASAMTMEAAALPRMCEWPQVRSALLRVYGAEAALMGGAAARMKGAKCAAG